MSWYLAVMKQYAVFKGRARRKEYWQFALFNALVYLVLSVIDAMSGNFSAEAGIGLLGGLYMLAVLVPSGAVSVRRLHDTDRSGQWMWIGLVPIVGAIMLFAFSVQDSRPGSNRFGMSPKEATA